MPTVSTERFLLQSQQGQKFLCAGHAPIPRGHNRLTLFAFSGKVTHQQHKLTRGGRLILPHDQADWYFTLLDQTTLSAIPDFCRDVLGRIKAEAQAGGPGAEYHSLSATSGRTPRAITHTQQTLAQLYADCLKNYPRNCSIR